MRRWCERPIPHGKGRWSDRGDECVYPRMKGKQRCVWHYLLSQPADVQASHAKARLYYWRVKFDTPEAATAAERSRVPAEHWPEGERWCAGCQSFVPLFYCTGSRCKACASSASHEARVQKVYGLQPGEYDALLELQGGRCFICQRLPGKKRLAVDHNHETGEPRGLLCASDEHGCNRAVLGNIKDIHAARRILLYLTATPYQRLHGRPALGWEDFVKAEVIRIRDERFYAPVDGTSTSEAPF